VSQKSTFGKSTAKKYFWKKYGKKVLLEKVRQKSTFGKSTAKKHFLRKSVAKKTLFKNTF
jgi:hypothetical protein